MTRSSPPSPPLPPPLFPDLTSDMYGRIEFNAVLYLLQPSSQSKNPFFTRSTSEQHLTSIFWTEPPDLNSVIVMRCLVCFIERWQACVRRRNAITRTRAGWWWCWWKSVALGKDSRYLVCATTYSSRLASCFSLHLRSYFILLLLIGYEARSISKFYHHFHYLEWLLPWSCGWTATRWWKNHYDRTWVWKCLKSLP